MDFIQHLMASDIRIGLPEGQKRKVTCIVGESNPALLLVPTLRFADVKSGSKKVEGSNPNH